MEDSSEDENYRAKPKISLVLEKEDYYFNEEGLMVFTEKYHLKRGYCCGNKCKHCPYGWERVKK